MKVYLDRQGQRMGPYSVDEINQFLGTGQVLITDMAWHGGLDEWVPLDQVPGVQNVAPQPSNPHPLWNSPSGAPPTAQAHAAPPTEKKSGGFLKGCLIVGGVISVLLIVGVGSCVLLIGSAANEAAEEAAEEERRVEEAPISSLEWREIDEIYNLKSNYTNLQKKELWKKYKGKKVKWSGKVSFISDTFGSLSLQVKMNANTFTSDLLIRLDDKERANAISLKEGDSVTFTGILNDWGTMMPITLDRGEIIE